MTFCAPWIGTNWAFGLVANFQLPVEGPLFDKVEFVELQREESEKLVETYNKEGREALPPPDKRYRDHGYDRGEY